MNRQNQNNICDQLLNFDHHSANSHVNDQPEESIQHYFEELFLNVPSPVNWVYEDIYLDDQPVSNVALEEQQESILLKGEATHELIAFNFLSKRLRIIEKYIIARAQEPIYEFDPQFDSDDEESYLKTKNIKLIFIAPKLQSVLSIKEEHLPYIKMGETTLDDPSIQIINFFKKMNLQELFWNTERIANQQKYTFLLLRRIIHDIKSHLVVKQQENKDKTQHRCKICKARFKNGRQLGGHMSRKHPGSSFDYATKRQVQFIKRLEKERRDYFKMRGLLA